MSQISILTQKELMFAGLDAKTDVEVLEALADAAIKAGVADESFKPALIEREKNMPTALNMNIPIAVPHIHTGCKKNFISVATLKQKVPFGNMADLTNSLPVQIVFLLGLESLSVQSRVLRHVCNSFQLSEQLAEYLQDDNSEALLERINNSLKDHIIVT